MQKHFFIKLHRNLRVQQHSSRFCHYTGLSDIWFSSVSAQTFDDITCFLFSGTTFISKLSSEHFSKLSSKLFSVLSSSNCTGLLMLFFPYCSLLKFSSTYGVGHRNCWSFISYVALQSGENSAFTSEFNDIHTLLFWFWTEQKCTRRVSDTGKSWACYFPNNVNDQRGFFYCV